MNSREQIEQDVLRNLPHLLQLPELQLPDMVRNNPVLLAENSEGRQPVPRNIDRYSFVPLTMIEGVEREEMLPDGSYAMPMDVQSHYHGGRPFLDGPAGIGIVVEKDDGKHLCAVGSVRIEEPSTLRIVQLQGVITDGEIGPQLGGFRWSEALILGLKAIAPYVGATAIEVAYNPERVLEWERGAEMGDEEAQGKLERYYKHYFDAPYNVGLEPSNLGTPRMTIEPRPMPALGAEAIEGGDTSIGAVRRAILAAIDSVEFGRDGASAKLALSRYLIDGVTNSLDGYDWRYSNFDREVVQPFSEALEAIDLATDAVHEALQAARTFEQRL